MISYPYGQSVRHVKSYKTEFFEQLKHESGLFKQVSQLELQGTHLPEIETSFLLEEQDPVH